MIMFNGPINGINLSTDLFAFALILCYLISSGFYLFLFVLLLFKIVAFSENRWISELIDLALQFVCAGFDRHSGAVEPEREQAMLAAQAVIPDCEFALGQRKCVAQMETPIHIWKRKSDQILCLS